MVEITDNQKQILPQNLLAQVAEDLKTPLIQITRLGELARREPSATVTSLDNIASASQSAVRLLDNYALALRLADTEPGDLTVELLSVRAIMANIAHEVEPLAASHGVKLELVATGKHAPVVANRQALASALSSLGRSLVEMISANNSADQQVLQLGLKKFGAGLEIGWYWQSEVGVGTATLRRGRALVGKSRQPLASALSSASSGVFVADYILDALDYHLKPSRLANLKGLAIRLKTSQQLALI